MFSAAPADRARLPWPMPGVKHAQRPYDRGHMAEVLKRSYASQAEYEQDLERQSREGWIVADVREEYTRVGCLAAITALLRRRPPGGAPRVIVTYRRAAGDA